MYFYKVSVRKGCSFCDRIRLNILRDATIMGQEKLSRNCKLKSDIFFFFNFFFYLNSPRFLNKY